MQNKINSVVRKKNIKLNDDVVNSRNLDDVVINEESSIIVTNELVSKATSLRYLACYPEVLSAIRRRGYKTIQEYYLAEGDILGYELTDISIPMLRQMDFLWILEQYCSKESVDARDSNAALVQYLTRVRSEKLNPNSNFNEHDYLLAYSEVAEGVEKGVWLCGFEHYIKEGFTKGYRSFSIIGVKDNKSIETEIVMKPLSIARYLACYPDVKEAIADGLYDDVFAYHGNVGKKIGRKLVEISESLVLALDIDWIRDTYNYELFENSSDPLVVTLQYLKNSRANEWCPNPRFDEVAYLVSYPDVQDAVLAGDFLCGFEHYVLFGRKESRKSTPFIDGVKRTSYEHMQQLERRIPGITRPVGLERVEAIRKIAFGLRSNFKIVNKLEPSLIAIIPHLDPDILFGGYKAFFEFIKSIQKCGIRTSFLISEPIAYDSIIMLLDHLKEKSAEVFEIVTMFGTPQLISNVHPVTVGQDDRIIAYSSSTARIANSLIKMQGSKKKFFFFIQEYEPIFLANGSHAFLTAEQFYCDNYYPIFNSKILMDYFLINKIGGKWLLDDSAMFFEHAIRCTSLSEEVMKKRRSKRFILYARPEGHAERNLFEISMLVMERAISQGIFADGWESFTGLGTLGTYASVQMPQGCSIEILPKLTGGDYYSTLQNYDLGMSLIMAPHPGVVHYEFARAGITTVTNIYPGRDAASMKAISSNIIPAIPSIEELVNALKVGVERASNISDRIRYAKEMSAPSTWEISFSEIGPRIANMIKTGN